ncbi:MAG TPA: hypothetical protein VL137_06770 [Polyangiaceae bacterium]|jgi:hypothetical protein|nr:hypothetical protein [Polyangiaceae bacterium]
MSAKAKSGDDSRVLSRKELAREMRRAAYRRAKEQRATDPRFIAMKAAAKEQRRALSQKMKEKRKNQEAAQKAHAKEQRGSQITRERAERQARALQEMQRVVQTADEWATGAPSTMAGNPSEIWMTKGSNAEN